MGDTRPKVGYTVVSSPYMATAGPRPDVVFYGPSEDEICALIETALAEACDADPEFRAALDAAGDPAPPRT